MKKLSKYPQGHWLNRLYSHDTFTHLKVEMEGNQYDYDLDDDEGDEFIDILLDRAGVNWDNITHAHGYNDGSVNTEVTATFKLTEDGISDAVKVIGAFNHLIDNTENAGMHLALLGNDAYDYDEQELDSEGLDNLKRQIQPVLPFIQLLGQSEEQHRGAYYCSNRVDTTKRGYPAVYIQEQKRIEFRFFHTCYHEPELLYHYLEVISRMIEYYDDPTKTLKLHGSSKTYEKLMDTSDFDSLARHKPHILPETLAFSDIYAQFSGDHSGVWRKATKFTPKSLPQQFAKKDYRDMLKKQKEAKEVISQRLSKDAVNWLIGDKSYAYDELNRMALAI